MQLAKVIGSVVSTQKSHSLTGKKLLLVQLLNADGTHPEQERLREEVAVDSVGAGEGEIVLIARGASARWVFSEPNEAIDLAIVGIVDSLSQTPSV
ncbi:Ethanolamine utilization protein EutN/carboxysome structural protein Ccml [Tolumonas auensis DSM 9187]|uniref:Ethanolamine utilization protein EutN/carboxysome structural protein Ccml n=1 Tax=Tolumonas auensis (strain DSM 9187 / NBRC 110442 / TA 4) TaxID=595494 RepID=C4LFD8_TOLAT|nr:EutN/CcmL family microcompartment protein [Tolumonas auensis]ACQ93305.1 Ethanolamine utilization protein EutN/carboxysome structural protein Ccml [Tolumonas auensis DSM 9187]